MRAKGLPTLAFPLMTVVFLFACGPGEGSITLQWPNKNAQEATILLQLFASNDPNTQGLAENCEAKTRKFSQGDFQAGDPVDVAFGPPFEGKNIPNFPAGNPLVIVVGYNGTGEDKKEIVAGCSEEFSTEDGNTEVLIPLQVVIPEDTRLLKISGDLQVGRPGGDLPVALGVRIDASLPGARDQRYPLPGVKVEISPTEALSLAGKAPGTGMELTTDSNGEVHLTAKLPAGSTSEEAVFEAKELYERIEWDSESKRREKVEISSVTFRVSGVEEASFGTVRQVALAPGASRPVDVRLGNVAGGSDLDLVLLSCEGPPAGCALGNEAVEPLGRTKISVLKDVASGRSEMQVEQDLGVTPSGLFVGRLLPPADGEPSGFDDIALVNARREEDFCRGPGLDRCERGEVRMLKGGLDPIPLRETVTLTASNAVGIAGFKDKLTDPYFGLVTSSQGRSKNERACNLGNLCLPFDDPELCPGPEGARECGCPPRERCECAPFSPCIDTSEPGICMAQDKELSVLHNTYVGATSGSEGFVDEERCELPRLICDRRSGAPEDVANKCSCDDNPKPCPANTTDTCGCKIPARVTIGSHGAGQLPFSVAAGELRSGKHEFVVGTLGGLSFIERDDPAVYRWKVQPAVNVPIHQVEIVDLDGDGGGDVAWRAAEACLEYPDQDSLCPFARVPPEEMTGCMGVYVRNLEESESKDKIEATRDGGCRRFGLDYAPDSLCHGDFNGDRNEDIALSSKVRSSLAIYLGDGQGGLLDPPQSIELPVAGGFLACEDLDRDGRTDLVVVSGDGADLILVLSGQ